MALNKDENKRRIFLINNPVENYRYFDKKNASNFC